MSIFNRLRNAFADRDAPTEPDPSFLFEAPPFVEAWLGCSDELSEESKLRIEAAADASVWITEFVRIQLSVLGPLGHTEWKGFETFLFGYVGGLAQEWSKKLGESSIEFQVFVVTSTLCLLYGKGHTGRSLLNSYLQVRSPDNAEFDRGLRVGARDFAVPEGVVPTGLVAAGMNLPHNGDL